MRVYVTSVSEYKDSLREFLAGRTATPFPGGIRRRPLSRSAAWSTSGRRSRSKGWPSSLSDGGFERSHNMADHGLGRLEVRPVADIGKKVQP